MAKSQKKSNKEIRKPKKDKSAAAAGSAPGSQVGAIPANPFERKGGKK